MDMSTVFTVTAATHVPAGGNPAPLFQKDSFADWIGRRVTVPGLDSTYPHVLTGVTVAQDLMSADLTITTQLRDGDDLAASLNVLLQTPAAYVRVVDDATNKVLVKGSYPAPLTEGQAVSINGQPATVLPNGVSWPNRDHVHGHVQADNKGHYPIDWQEVRVSLGSQPTVGLL